ncbi:MAG: LysM peptidoglycan-binding domain-containing protein [Anaerolineae bacterium]|nr:LysM peptidoglycan-binding domain-containing protein [Anaerolineae bacterium]
MRRLSTHLLWLAALLILAVLPGFAIQAQTDPNPICTAAQERSTSAFTANCGDLPEGFACYGATGVQAIPKTPREDFFNFEGARASLQDFVSLQVTGVEATGQWGVAAINLGDGAVASASDPYENVLLVLTGNARLEQTTAEEPNVKAFLFFTDRTTCVEAPAALVIRTPEDKANVQLNINGAKMSVSSTVILRTLPPGNVMQLYTVEGNVVLEQPGGGSTITVSTGQTTVRCLSEPDNIGFDGQSNDRIVTDSCGWTTPVPVTLEEQLLSESLLKLLGDNVVSSLCPNGGTNLVHNVARGETIARIAARYGVTIADIVRENNIINLNLIFVGQSLKITCGVDIGYTPVLGGGGVVITPPPPPGTSTIP